MDEHDPTTARTENITSRDRAEEYPPVTRAQWSPPTRRCLAASRDTAGKTYGSVSESEGFSCYPVIS